MQLLTIADLARPHHEIMPLIKEAQTLSQLYKNFVLNDNETHTYSVTDFGETTRAPGFHASELSGCFRKLVYSRWGTQKQPRADIVFKMKFRLGTAMHGMIQSDFERMAATTGGRIFFKAEEPIAPELQDIARYWQINSHTDGVFTFCNYDPASQTWYPYLRVGLEIKSMSDGEFSKANEPKEDHKDQTTVYQRCLDVPLMWTLYYNKSNSNITDSMAPWLFQFDHARWAALEKRMMSALQYINESQLPAREEGLPCKWCPFAWHCEPNMLKKKDSYKPPPVPAGMRRR